MPPFSRPAWADALHATAHAWTDPDHAPRTEAITAATDADAVPFEEAHITFAVNQQMEAAVRASLHEVAQQPAGPSAAQVRLAASIPLYGLPLIAYLTLRGTRVCLAEAPGTRPVLHAMLHAAAQALPDEAAAPVQWAAAAPESAPVIAMGPPAADAMDAADVVSPEQPAWVVLDGNESADEREALAEDLLVYDGEAPQRVGLIWAPEDAPPDAYLDAVAHMRAAVPAHARVPGTLQMQRAFLEAQDRSHAYIDPLTFLLSKGAPEPQRGLHVRWTPYADLGDLHDALADARSTGTPPVGSVRCREALVDRVARHVPNGIAVAPLGTLHRADWWPPAVQALSHALNDAS